MRKIFLPAAIFSLALISGASAAPIVSNQPLFPAPVGKKWAFIDQKGRQVFAPHYDELGTYAEGMWPVRVGKKWGFISETAQDGQHRFIEPRFDAVARFSEGLSAAKSGAKWGYIGKNGVWQIAPQFIESDAFSSELYAPFSQGLASVEVSQNLVDKNGWRDTRGYINRQGKWVLEPQFSMADPFSEDMASVVIYAEGDSDPGQALVRRESNGSFSVVRPPKNERWYEVEPFMDGLAAVRGLRNNKALWGFIGKDGQWVLEPQYLEVLGLLPSQLSVGFRDGLALVVTGTTAENVRLGWIDKSGQWAIEPKYNGGGAPFVEGLAPVGVPVENKQRRVGWISTNGQWAIEPRFEQTGIFTDGLAPAREPNGKWGYIDKTGNWVIQPAFDYVSMYDAPAPQLAALQFREGLAWVQEGKTRGYIDKKRNWVWKAK